MKSESELEDTRKVLQSERMQNSNQISNLEKEVNRYQLNSNQLNEAVSSRIAQIYHNFIFGKGEPLFFANCRARLRG